MLEWHLRLVGDILVIDSRYKVQILSLIHQAYGGIDIFEDKDSQILYIFLCLSGKELMALDL